MGTAASAVVSSGRLAMGLLGWLLLGIVAWVVVVAGTFAAAFSTV